MQTSKYGKIPRNSLISALGALRTTVVHTAYAPSPEVCIKCAHLGDKNHNCALTCPYRGQELQLEETRYVYESRKTSSENRTLSLIGLKTLVYLHMMTRNGGINNFDPEEAADDMNCCTLSVKNALEQLQDRKYILYQKDSYSGLYTILINDYTKELNRTANHNGLGYITINSTFASALMSCKNITTARLLLRAYDLIYSKKHHTNNITVYMKELLKAFPEYVSKTLILKTLESLTDVLKFGTKRNRLSIYFSPEVNAEAAFTEERTVMQKHIVDFINTINDNILDYQKLNDGKTKAVLNNKPIGKLNTKIHDTICKLKMLGFKDSNIRIDQNFLSILELTDKELIDFTNIGMKYGASIFDKALIKACEETTEFTKPTGALKSRGAFLHSIAKDLVYWQDSNNNYNQIHSDYRLA